MLFFVILFKDQHFKKLLDSDGKQFLTVTYFSLIGKNSVDRLYVKSYSAVHFVLLFKKHAKWQLH